MNRAAMLEQVYREWKDGNYRAGFELYDEDMLLQVHNPIPDAGIYEGLAGLQRYMRGFLETWDEYAIRAEGIDVEGDSLIVEVHHAGRASGAPVEMTFFQVWTFEGDRVVRVDIGADREITPRASR